MAAPSSANPPSSIPASSHGISTNSSVIGTISSSSGGS